MRQILALIIICLFVSGCLTEQPMPTAASIEASETETYLTSVAPPPGFEQVVFREIDKNLSDLPYYDYVVSLAFDGVHSDTQKAMQGVIRAEVYSNGLGGERRVVLEVSGEAFNVQDKRRIEGVRISNDYYLVDQNNTCGKVTDAASRGVADLSAGNLIGGINNASFTTNRKKIGEIDSRQYVFSPDDIVPPPMQFGEGGTVSVASGDLWVTPENKVVVEYSITLNIKNATIQGNGPLTGQIRANYKLGSVGVPHNISIPNGC
jgi:hypothetical protein